MIFKSVKCKVNLYCFSAQGQQISMKNNSVLEVSSSHRVGQMMLEARAEIHRMKGAGEMRDEGLFLLSHRWTVQVCESVCNTVALFRKATLSSQSVHIIHITLDISSLNMSQVFF